MITWIRSSSRLSVGYLYLPAAAISSRIALVGRSIVIRIPNSALSRCRSLFK